MKWSAGKELYMLKKGHKGQYVHMNVLGWFLSISFHVVD